MKVKNIVVSVQKEKSNNFDRLLKIINERKIRLIIVDMGDKLEIEKDVYFDIVWPDKSNLISENALNNNSIVCKLNYQNFSCLFTGDIEKIAEEKILKEHQNDKTILHSTVLKAAHHGSKTSSIKELLETVNPKMALIGVGKNNKFGHPSPEVLERLENLRNESF